MKRMVDDLPEPMMPSTMTGRPVLHQGLFTLFLAVRTRLEPRQSRRTTTPRLDALARTNNEWRGFKHVPSGFGQKGQLRCCADWK